MKTLETPVVPESLRPYATEHFYDVVDRYASQSLDSIVRTMPDYEIHNRYKNDEPAVGAVLYRPKNFDSTHAVVVPYPFGNGHGPSMHIRTQLTQKVLGNNMQILAFPNNTVDEQYYALSEQQRAQVASGDATPLAAGILGVAEDFRLESLDLLCYSQGSFIAAAVMKLARMRDQLHIKHALIAEPPTVVERTSKELKKAFLATGLGPLVKAVRASSIPALTEAQGMLGMSDKHRLLGGLLMALKNSKLPENKVLHAGMTHGNLLEVLEEAGGCDYLYGVDHREGTHITLARAEKSKVTPPFSSALSLMAAQEIIIEGYGHEAADNVAGVSALLAKYALGDELLVA